MNWSNVTPTSIGRRHVEAIRERLPTGTVRERLPAQYWPLIVAPLVLLLQLWMYAPFPATHHVNQDSATFHYGGNLLARGYAPYLYLWDVKPPLVYDTTAVLALLAPNDPMTQFYAGSFLTSAAGLGTILLAGAIVYRSTGHNLAALATASTILAYTQFVYLPGAGIWTKYFALFFGFLGVYLALSGRPIVGVAAATLAPGFWQLGAIFPLIALLFAWRQEASLPLAVGAAAAVTAIAVAPVVALGGLYPMLQQAIVTPLSMADQSAGLLSRIQKFRRIATYSWPVFYAAALCGAYHVYDRRDAWWLGLGGGWALLQIGFLDFDAAPDPLMLVTFLAIGLGLFVGRLDRRQQLAVVLVVLSIVTAGLYAHRGPFVGTPSTENPDKPIHEHFLEGRYPPSTCLIAYGGLSRERRKTDDPLPKTCYPPSVIP
jgi:hypothetical protein